ncbi:esterase E4-like [Planococcus citri]|uniref:esterase E4-like n=1 Tax=Planococcus citri TaxID=170843 RepID=UPI0031F9481E
MFHGSPDPSYHGAPDYIMHHDVVYVCVGFRLHVLGLLNLKLENCSGNQVLKDIILSLRWIKENIHVFGGDPENITVMGASSGSAYVHLLLLSPLAKGLYHKAILMGMYIFNPLLVHSRDVMTPAYEAAKTLGYTGPRGDDKKLLTFYKKLDVLQIIAARLEKYFNETTIQVFPTSPFIPNAAPGEKSPLPVSPEKLIPSTNRVPILIGFCRREAAIGIALANSSSNPNHMADNFHKAIAQNCWGWGGSLNDDELTQIKEEVENFYLKGKSARTASGSLLCDILTDAALSGVYDSLINVISADLPSSVYAYNFYYDGKLDGLRGRIEKMLRTPLKGAFHAADFDYWRYDEKTVGKRMEHLQQKDRNMIDTITSLLTTFAKTGNPNYEGMEVNWKPTNPEHPSHLIIDETLDARDEVLNGERLEFWLRLKKKFRKDCNDNL